MGSSTKKAKGDRGKADVLFSKIVRSLGYCERCGTRDYSKLTTSHIIKRRYSATRTYLPNAQALCYKDHYYFENWPREFSHWVTDSIGSDIYDHLKAKANEGVKVNWAEELIRLDKIWQSIEVGETTFDKLRKASVR